MMQRPTTATPSGATTAKELSDDALEGVTGGKASNPATIGIVREPTRHPAKVVVPD